MKKKEKMWIGVLTFLDTGLLLIILCLLLLPKGDNETIWENKEQQVFMEKNPEKNLAGNKETVIATTIKNEEEIDTKKAEVTKESKAEEIKRQKQLINKQIKTIPDTIVKKVYGDFDGDGMYEAFVLAGSKEENGIYGKLWFVTKENAVSLNVGHTGIELLEPKLRIIKEGKKSFLICDQKEVKHLSSTVWKVNQNIAEKILWGAYFKKGTKNYKLIYYTYDSVCDSYGRWSGETKKSYLYYYDKEKNAFLEYGGKKMKSQQFFQYEGAKKIWNTIRSEFPNSKINLLYYKNKRICINYHYKQAGKTYYRYHLLKITGKKVEKIQSGKGYYLSALNVDKAVYEETIP